MNPEEMIALAEKYEAWIGSGMPECMAREYRAIAEGLRLLAGEEMENYRMALAYISRQSEDQQSRELAEAALNAFPVRGLPQSPGLSREAILSAVIKADNCGIGDTGPDGKHRSIACNDESLKDDRYYYFEDCSCSKIADAILALAASPDTRPVLAKPGLVGSPGLGEKSNDPLA